MERHPLVRDWVTCPGETLAEWFTFNNVPHAIAWKLYRIPETVLTGLFDGVEPLTPDLAAKLNAMTFIPARIWLAMEHNYRAGLAAGLQHTHED